jgi:cruciform cutting endonuclease 1
MAAKSIAAVQLRALLARIGSVASGTKPALQARLAQDLQTPRLPLFPTTEFKASSGQSQKKQPTTRILSIDMGIKNLAFCVADVNISFNPQSNPSSPPTGHISAIAWRRVDVAWETAKTNSDPLPKDSDGGEAADDPFHPRNLSTMAHALLTRILLPYEPDIILIERQRYRSGGGAAIQEWTVRVNMLEGMLWAVLATLREGSHSTSIAHGFPTVFDVSPARVAAFWVDAPKVERVRKSMVLGEDGEVMGTEEKSVLARGKVTKPLKVQLVRSWLSAMPFASKQAGHVTKKQELESTIPLTFSFSKEAEETRMLLCSPASRAKQTKPKSAVTGNPRKFDDLADCFLQAAAWVAWEGARLNIVHNEGDFLLEESRTTKSEVTVKTRRKGIKPATTTGEEETKEPAAVVKKTRRKAGSVARKGKIKESRS